MFNSKRVFGLALISIATALSGCGGGGSGQPGFDTVCSDGEALTADGSCQVRPHVCEAGTVYPDGILPDETTSQADCVPIEFDGPSTVVAPSANQVILFYNRQHIDADYSGVNLYRFGDCWADGGTPDWPGLPAERDGVDETYGAYYILEIDPDAAGCGSSASYIWNYNGDANKTNDLTVGFTAGSSPWNARGFFVPSDDGRLPGAEGGRAGDVSSSGIPVCIPPEPGVTTECLTPNPPARLVKDASFHWISNNVFAHNVSGAMEVVLYRDETPSGLFEQEPPVITVEVERDANGDLVLDDDGNVIPVLDDDGNMILDENGEEVANPDAGTIIVDDGSDTGNGVSVVASLVEDAAATAALPEEYEGWYAYIVPEGSELSDDEVKSILKDPLLVSYFTSPDLLGTRVQAQTIIDSLYVGGGKAEAEDLGLTYSDSGITLKTWAPTAENLSVVVFAAGIPRFEEKTVGMTEDTSTGVWSVTLPLTDDGKFYRLSVSVVDQGSGTLRNVQTPDPYGVSASTDSVLSQFVNLNHELLIPEGWANHTIADGRTEDLSVDEIMVYSGYLRDFTADDTAVTEANRGKYLGLTEAAATARTHLAALQDAGVTHLNFLPLADSFGVTEAESYQLNLDDTIFSFCRQFASEIKTRDKEERPLGDICDNGELGDQQTIRSAIEQLLAATTVDEDTMDTIPDTAQITQAYTLLENIRRVDNFNWGYAPILPNVPEGSFASLSDGPTRVLELRQMVQAIHGMGLRVSMDVMYSYFTASGLENPKSVFDKLVPGYYIRRDPVSGLTATEVGSPEEGVTEVFADTASENAMMADFIKDSLEFWATEYKIDAFRFVGIDAIDSDAIAAASAAVQAINPEAYVYGKVNGGVETVGSNTGEQAGTGVGEYNEVLAAELRNLTLFKASDLRSIDKIRVGLAGNLASFPFYSALGAEVTGSEMLPFGASGESPSESVAYVTQHENGQATLWDLMHLGENYTDVVSALDADERTRVQLLTLSIPAFAQGGKAFQLGTDLLRSRSLETEASNSGDWFNKVDFSETGNNWGVALPLSPEDTSAEELVFEDAALSGGLSAQISRAADVFAEYLEIASSSELFNLTSAADINARVGFHNQGVDQTPGVIVMSIDDAAEVTSIDSVYDAIVIVFNATGDVVNQAISTANNFDLHPVQDSGADSVISAGASFTYDPGTDVGTFTVPAYSTAVFVQLEGDGGLSRNASPAPAATAPYGSEQIYLRGSVTDTGWGTYADNEFVWVGGDVYELVVPVTTAPPSNIFKIAAREWADLEIADAAGSELTLDTPLQLNATCALDGVSCSDNRFAFQANTTYLFSLDASSTAAPQLTISIAEDAPYAVDIYMRGYMNSWNSGAPEDLLVYEGYGYYGLTRVMPANDANNSFKFADAGYTNDPVTGTNFGIPGGAATIDVGVPTTLEGNDGQNILFPVAEETAYYFELNARDVAVNPILTISEAPYSGLTPYMRGTHLINEAGDSGWGPVTADYGFQYMGGGIYQLDTSFNADQLAGNWGAPAGEIRFKIADEGWSGTIDQGIDSTNNPVAPGAATELSGSANIEWAPVEGTMYRIIYDISGSQPTLRITPFKGEG